VLYSQNVGIPLGEGAFAFVVKREYTDKKGNLQQAAFKKCKPNTDPEMEKTFEKEIETLRQLNHLFVVKYIDVVVESDSEKYNYIIH
jgi:serine/threonine protein kinase